MTDKNKDTRIELNPNRRDAIRAARVKRTADIVGCSTDLVYAVLATERNNELVEDVYFQVQEADMETDNKLKEAVRNLVKF